MRIDLLMFPNVRLAEALCCSRLCVREVFFFLFFFISAEAAPKGSMCSCSVTVEIHRNIFAKKKKKKKKSPEEDLLPCCVYLSKLCLVIYRINEVQPYILFVVAAQLLLTNPADAHESDFDLLLFFYHMFFFQLTHFVFVFI